MVNQNFADTVIQFDDGVTITRGKHVFKTGFQMWRFRLNTFYTGNSGAYGSILFGGSFSGDPASDFFTGYPVATGKGVSTGGTWHQFAWRYGGYGQDDWRITPTLTLNLGSALRSDHSLGGTEQPPRQPGPGYRGYRVRRRQTAIAARFITPNTVYPLSNPASDSPGLRQLGKARRLLRGAYTISSYLEGTGTNLRLARNPPFTPTEVTA